MSDVIRYDLERIDYEDFEMVMGVEGRYVEYEDYKILENTYSSLQNDYEDLIEELRQVRKEYSTLVNKLGEIYRDA